MSLPRNWSMPRRLIACLALLFAMPLILAFMPQAFADTTFSCTAVRDKANVGVHDNVSVNITTSTNVCNFSVAGANVTSTSATEFDTFARGLVQFVQGLEQGAGQDSVARSLASLLFGEPLGMPAPTDTENTFVQNFGFGALSTLNDCLQSARGNNTQTFTSDPIFCSSIGEGQSSELPGGVTLSTSTGGITFGARLGETTSMLYVPNGLLEQARQGHIN